MRRFDDRNPIAVAVYYLCVLCLTMFSMNPLLLCLSLLSSVATCIMHQAAGRRAHVFTAVLFLIATAVNPIAVHNGVTVLFYVNDKPFTLEAVLYGVFAAVMIAAALYWLRALSKAMTSDKVLYLFGRFSPKIALILSMSMRYVALFRQRWRRIRDCQRALGLYRDENLIDAVRGNARVLSILITWTLENGIVTAESMEARGYGVAGRTSFAAYQLHAGDVVLIAVCLALTAVAALGIAGTEAIYYPALNMRLTSVSGIAGAAAFAVLGFLPVMIDIKEGIKWRCLTSKI